MTGGVGGDCSPSRSSTNGGAGSAVRYYGNHASQPDSGGIHAQSPLNENKFKDYSHHASPSYVTRTPGGLSVYSNNPGAIQNNHLEEPNLRLKFTPIKQDDTLDGANENDSPDAHFMPKPLRYGTGQPNGGYYPHQLPFGDPMAPVDPRFHSMPPMAHPFDTSHVGLMPTPFQPGM